MKNSDYARRYIGKTVTVKVDRPVFSKHPEHDFVYKVNYGFVPHTKAPDGEEVDAYILGIKHALESFTGECIAVIHRLGDANDDKLIVVPKDVNMTNEDIMKEINFQEKRFASEIWR